MRRNLPALLAIVLVCAPAKAEVDAAAAIPTRDAPADALVGRWDIGIHTPDGDRPSWLEVRRSGSRTRVGQFVGAVGSARPISRIDVDGSALRFALPPQWESGAGEMVFEGKLQGDTLAGAMTYPDGRRFQWTARRAPSLSRPAGEPGWGAPIALFNGRDLSGWRTLDGASKWRVEDGVLRNTAGGANLATTRTFGDFKLHIELKLPRGSNSGVYLRGRHEVQIADSAGEPASDSLGAVYGFLAPSHDAAKGADDWQSLDITLVGRTITVVVNGTTVICDREIPGITGGALDSDEGAPGPLMLQGDHGPIAFRNLVLTPAK